MRKANEPAYPQPIPGWSKEEGFLRTEEPGLSKREKLAMEIYERMVSDHRHLLTDEERNLCADYSIRAADIFFEVMEKNGNR